MTMKHLLTFFALSALLCGQSAAAQAPQPNILVLLTDDVGWGDYACYNPESKIRTPHVDRLAREGMRFTHAHSPAALCSPTRYSMLTSDCTDGVHSPWEPAETLSGRKLRGETGMTGAHRHGAGDGYCFSPL